MDHVDNQEVVTAQTGVARMRLDQKPFDDPRVRKALRLATDASKVLQIAHKDVGEAAEHHHVCPMHPDYIKLPAMARDVEAAKKLLAEAGFADGLDIEINCKPDPSWEQAAVETMVGQWKEAGINAKINVLPSAKFWEVWDKVPFGFTEWTHRPLGFMVLALAYRTGVPWNESAYSNKQFDELLTKAEGTLDVKARVRDHRRAREDHAGGRTDRAALVAVDLLPGRQEGEGLHRSPDAVFLLRRVGHRDMNRPKPVCSQYSSNGGKRPGRGEDK